MLEKLEIYGAGDVKWRSGRSWTYVYDAGEAVDEVAKAAFTRFMSENAIDPTYYPSLLRFEQDVVAMAASHLGGGPEVVGSFTSGGTESCMMAVKTARDYCRAHRPEVTEPELILPVTGHAAFHKGGEYFGVKVVPVPVDAVTFQADMAAVEAAINANTILLVGSAPAYGHGVVDPIRELGALALERGLLFHVDACIGGFLLPYFRRLGVEVPDFDFSVPGVSSMSMDLHKYAFCPKGASVVLYRDKDLRKHQIFACAKWTGYSVVNNTFQSTKSGGPVAAAWAVLNFLGDDGYEALARDMLDATRAVVEGVEQIPDLQVLGNPEMTLIAIGSETINVFHVADELKLRGWNVLVQLAFGEHRENLHLSVNPSNTQWVEDFLEALRQSVAAARELPDSPAAAMIKQTFAAMEPDQITDEVFAQMTAMAGINGTELPERMAEINEMLNVLPTPLAERLLKEFMNDLYVHPGEPE